MQHNTVILGLGSNIGDRLAHLRRAISFIKTVNTIKIVQYSPIYESDAMLPDNAPNHWDQPYLNAAITCKTTLTPKALLAELKTIEQSIGREQGTHWGPRVIDIDILTWESRVIRDETLHIPHTGLLDRPFQLWPLADLTPHWCFPAEGHYQGQSASQIAARFGSRHSGEAPYHTRQIKQRLVGPKLVGVLNITPDSFSDGGKFHATEEAIRHAQQLIADGAEVIDIGAEATSQNIWNTHAKEMSHHPEWERLAPVLNALEHFTKNTPSHVTISVDTRNPDTARRCLEHGVHWINDVTGFDQPDMINAVKDSHARLVIMHHRGVPPSKKNVMPFDRCPVETVLTWIKHKCEQLDQAGIDRDRFILDVGIGFGNTPDQAMTLIKNIASFNSLDLPLLIGHSRKSFLSLFTDASPVAREAATLAVSHYLAQKNIEYLRVHNVLAHSELLAVQSYLQ